MIFLDSLNLRYLLLISIIVSFLLDPVSAQSFSYQRTVDKISIKKAEDIFINDTMVEAVKGRLLGLPTNLRNKPSSYLELSQ